MIKLNIILILRFLLKLIKINQNGLKLASMCWWSYRKKIQINRSGLESLRKPKKISIFKSTGLSGLMRIKKKNQGKKDLEVLILLKCKVSLEWVVWEDFQEWVWGKMKMMKSKMLEILMILINKRKFKKNHQLDHYKNI